MPDGDIQSLIDRASRPLAAGVPLAVRVQGLNHWYGEGELRRLVLRDIDFGVERGRTTFLMGPSGCGKTTLLTLVGGLRSALQGSIRVLGRELMGAREAELVAIRRRCGFVFQHHNLHRSLTVFQNVRMGLEVRGEAGRPETADRCMAALQAVGLGDHADKRQDQISGGQRQRAAIARALVGNPELLLADEPTAALDSRTGREVIELMNRLAQDGGMTVLMVTHDNRILDIADRIVTMEDGRILPPASRSADDPAGQGNPYSPHTSSVERE